jgi:phosphopantetheinyl transferase
MMGRLGKLRTAAAGWLLASKLGVRLDSDLVYGEHGKPYLVGAGQGFFSLTHSGPYVAVAVSESECGLDIEELRLKITEGLVKKVLNGRELKIYNEELWKNECFCKFWTGKEAILKAEGTGLIDNLQQLSIFPDENGQYRHNKHKWYLTWEILPGAWLCYASFLPEEVKIVDETENFLRACYRGSEYRAAFCPNIGNP